MVFISGLMENMSEGEGENFLTNLFFAENFTISHRSENSILATMEERILDMFTQLSV